ncbi:Mut7-C RNAse domain-containing protein [Streptomyces sp. NPDC050428]|uniref:Mut7-C RNAse domain-containing protein n=1 Tax=Streptomyces sp. NPDC050428 TaxID=3155757 RepID=UPI0034149FB7
MNGPEIHLTFAPELHVFVPAGRRDGRSTVTTDGSSTLGHVVESLGVPLTEAGQLLVDGRPVATSHIPSAGESVEVRAVARPQRVPGAPLRFLLDVHLGTLARRLRDVLERFAPALAPWTRCTACNGRLGPADKDSVEDRLEQGTQRTYDVFAQCTACGRVYWRGAHHARLAAIVDEAVREFGGTAV